jgi:hypothetical protein
MKQKYIKRYGNAYQLPSPHSRELMDIFTTTCKEHGILYKPEDCFDYMREFPEKYKQMSIFDFD